MDKEDNDQGNPAISNASPALESAAEQVGADAPAIDQPVAEALDGKPVDAPVSKLSAMLDTLTEDPNGTPDAKPVDAAADDAKPAADTKPAVEVKPATPPTPEQEEAELLDGVKSDRGKERIRQVFSEKKALEKDLNDFREMVNSTGMSPQEFARTLEFGRLMSSGAEQDLLVALEMVEGQRAALYQRLGREAPGVDLLAGHDDLKAAVDGMEITRERAVELATLRKGEADRRQAAQLQQQSAQNQQEFTQQVQQASAAMDAYLSTRINEVDHPARMKVISDHFRNPANLQAFVTTYRPDQWAATVKMMYDNIAVHRPAAPAANQPQPLRSRPAVLGTPTANSLAPIDRLSQRMESMGL